VLKALGIRLKALGFGLCLGAPGGDGNSVDSVFVLLREALLHLRRVRVQSCRGAGFRGQGLGFRVQGSLFMIYGFGFRV
jgi:hypothetical protein